MSSNSLNSLVIAKTGSSSSFWLPLWMHHKDTGMGIQRNDDPRKLEPLNALNFGVRVEREGKLLKDFHMVHEMVDKKDSHVTERYYLSDAVFVAALESDDKAFLEQIAAALRSPVYPLFLGRRSCPPTLPLVLGIRDDMEESQNEANHEQEI